MEQCKVECACEMAEQVRPYQRMQLNIRLETYPTTSVLMIHNPNMHTYIHHIRK